MLRNELETRLIDADPSFDAQQHVKVAVNQRGVSIEAPSYGDFGTAKGHGSPVFLELHQGRLRLVVWADINDEEPTHIIDLAGAKEDRRIVVLPEHPLGQQGE